MSRHDLLALTPESVATLTNRGLVKRAQREIAAGQGPTLCESADGVVEGAFPDGAVARLPPGVQLHEAPCTCGATTVCRHRVAVALAYSGWHGERGPLGSAADRDAVAWSPGSIDDRVLEEVLGRRTLERARQQRCRGCDVEVRRAAGAVGPLPEARLPTCNVQFLVPRDLAYARCECALGQGCEHVAIAVWAFRIADAAGLGPIAIVHVAAELSDAPGLEALDAAVGLGREILAEGVVNLAPSFAGKVAHARAALVAAGFTWPETIVDDLDDQLSAYRSRSARYSPEAAARWLVELAARSRAARAQGALPARTILGIGEARETPIAHLRLVSLGARVEGGGRERLAEVYLADPSTGTVVTLRKSWTYAEGEAIDDGMRLGSRSVVPGVRLRDLAHGQVVTHAAKRLANRLVKLGAARKGSLSVTPQTNDWRDFPVGLVIEDLAAHAASLRRRPPRALRPRILAESIHVVGVKEVSTVGYLPGQQALVATVVTDSGFALQVRRRHRGVAPKALEVLASGLRGCAGTVRWLSGNLFVAGDRLEMDPISVVADRLMLLDLDEADMPEDVPLAIERPSEDPIQQAVQEAWSCLELAAHSGLRRMTSTWTERLGLAAERLSSTGLVEAAERCRRLAQVSRRLLESRNDTDAERMATWAWEGAAIRLSLTQELLAQGAG